MNSTYWLWYNRVTNQGGDCSPPCHSLMTVVGGKNVVKYVTNPRNYSEAYFYFAPRVMLSQELPLYSGLSLLAELGGYLGLTLGASMLDLLLLGANACEAHVKRTEKQ